MAAPGRLVGRPGGVTATRRQAALGTISISACGVRMHERVRARTSAWSKSPVAVLLVLLEEGGEILRRRRELKKKERT